MDSELIVRALESYCGNKNLKFQVIVQNSKLHIYINHKTVEHPDSSFLIDRVINAIAPLPLDDLKGAWLYSRRRGEVEPHWQTYLEFPLEVDTDILDTVGFSQGDAEQIAEFTEFPESVGSGNTGLLDNTGMIHKEALHEEINTFASESIDKSEATENLDHEFDFEAISEPVSSGNTGLLDNTGMIHKEALHEEEINTFASRLTKDSTDLPNAVETDGDSSSEQDGLNLANYCFVINKKILTEDILPPDKETIRLVKFFHHLSDNNKHRILPILNDYFKLAKIPDLQQLSVSVQKWFQQITELDDSARRIVEIWLSRYCFARDATMEELQTAGGKGAVAIEKKQQRSNTEYAFTPANSDRSTNAKPTDELTNKSPILLTIQKHIVPLAWTLGTLVLIILGVFTTNFREADQANPALCSGSLGSVEYCRLGVNLAGAKNIKNSSATAFALTEITAVEATKGCERYANVKAGIIKDFDPQKTPVISSYGEQILPHVYVVEAKQKSVKQPGDIRVGCVYRTGKGERSPELIKADFIPLNWPSQPYQSQVKSQSDISFGIFTYPIKLGLYTIFAAIGIAIAARLSIGIEITRLPTIYLVALAVGIMQTIAGLNLLAGIIFPVLAMVAMSLLLKDFRLQRNFGYLVVAGGMFVIIATQFLLYGLFQLIINGLV